MDSIFNAIKNFLLTEVNDSLSEESSIELTAFDDKRIIFGLVDVSKFQGSKVIASVLPERQSLGQGNAAYTVLENEILLTVICGADTFERIQKKTVLYAKAIESCILQETQWPDTIEDVHFESAEYTFDAGSAPGQLSAVEIRLTVDTEINDPTDDLFD